MLMVQLGEGGYSFVYLVKELPVPERLTVPDARFALKKVLGRDNALEIVSLGMPS